MAAGPPRDGESADEYLNRTGNAREGAEPDVLTIWQQVNDEVAKILDEGQYRIYSLEMEPFVPALIAGRMVGLVGTEQE